MPKPLTVLQLLEASSAKSVTLDPERHRTRQRQITRRLVAKWTRWSPTRLTCFFKALTSYEEVKRDPRLDDSDPRVQRARAETLEYIDWAIADGLRRRVDHYLIPPAGALTDTMLDDFVLFQFMLAFVPAVGRDTPGEWPKDVALCGGCSLVFRPNGRDLCDVCRGAKRRPVPTVLGLGHGALNKPGDRVTVREPKLGRIAHRLVVTGWSTTTVGLCVECCEPFTGDRRSEACPSCRNARKQRAYRARQARSGGP